MSKKSPQMRKMVAQGSQRWPKGSKMELKVVKKRPKIGFGDLEFDMVFTVRTPYWEVLGGFPKRQKYGCFSEPSQEGSRGAPMAQRWSKGSKTGAQRVSKMEQKASKRDPKNTPSFLWHPLGAHRGPGTILDGFGVDFGGF